MTIVINPSEPLRYDAGPGGTTFYNTGPDNAYYATSSSVTSTTYDGVLTVGASVTLIDVQFFIVAAGEEAILEPGPAGSLPSLDAVVLRARVPVNVKDKGAVGDGTTNDTSAFQAALAEAAGARAIYVPSGTYMLSALTLTQNTTFIGVGDTSAVKQIAATNSHLFTCTTNNLRLRFNGLRLDGNQANQTNDASHFYNTINVAANSTAAATPQRVEISDCTFANGRGHDLYLAKNSVETASTKFFATVDNCRFLGGAEADASSFAASSMEVVGGVSLRVSGSLFDLQATPTIGRAGITVDSATTFGRLVVDGNEFRDMGTTLVSGTLGSIDCYSGAVDTVISNNQIVRPCGRGINVKSDNSNVTITGNTVDGLQGTTLDAQITCNRLVHGTVAGNMTITGNSCLNSAHDGISVSGGSTLGAGNAGGFIVADNVVTGATRRGIGLVGVGDTSVTGNMVTGAASDGMFVSGMVGVLEVVGNTITAITGNGIEFDTTNTACTINISDNLIGTPTGRGIYVGSAVGGKISGNVLTDCGNSSIQVLNTTDALLVLGNVAKGTNAVFTDGGSNSKLVLKNNLFGAPSSLTTVASATTMTLSGSVDEFSVTGTTTITSITASWTGRKVTLVFASTAGLTDGSNLKLNGNLSGAANTAIALVSDGTNWIETARSAN